MEPQETTTPLGKIAAILTILGILIGAIFWVANVSATASHADQTAQSASQKLDSKADKQDLQEMKQDIKEIRDYLLNGKRSER